MSKHPLLEALLPLADILGIQILDKDEISESDLHLLWEGEVVGGVRRHNSVSYTHLTLPTKA